jgi:hypothetical protein
MRLNALFIRFKTLWHLYGITSRLKRESTDAHKQRDAERLVYMYTYEVYTMVGIVLYVEMYTCVVYTMVTIMLIW